MNATLSGRVNLIESLDKNEFDFQAQLKERTKNDYGLKYEITTISNGFGFHFSTP